ncbi:MAG TPA: LamG-like jellyroll fold domain-containing protein, partial [Candidatus Dormibacteraeota bacterium]|nr:LamG-like jellyroll fold domain-containing protein [Candidatus Dormibacteraeota bacterium]
TATGPGPITYQWLKGGNPIPNATSPQLVISPVTLGDSGTYRVRVTNPGGTVQSSESQLVVLPALTGSVTNDLVVHLTFDDDLADGIADDSSGRGNNGTTVGAPEYVPGRLGTALRYSNAKDGSFFNYVSLGMPDDLNFGTDVNFSISFWTKFTTWTGDPSFVANKNWNSGGNVGYVIATAGNGGLQWNAAPTRIDYDGPGGTLANNNWHHVVFSWDRAGLISTYLDGVQVNNTPNGAARDLNSGLPTNIGQDGTGTYTDNGGVGIEDGTIDDLGIWRRALSPAEAIAIYQAGLAGKDLSKATLPPPVTTDLVTYLAFEDNLNDGSGHTHNGTAVGNVSFVSGRVGKGL